MRCQRYVERYPPNSCRKALGLEFRVKGQSLSVWSLGRVHGLGSTRHSQVMFLRVDLGNGRLCGLGV